MRQSNDPDALSQAFAEPSRRALLENLRYGPKTVTQLVEATALKQPNVSNHLAKMRQQGIVRAERVGRQVYYSLAMPFADVLLRMHEAAANPDKTASGSVYGLEDQHSLRSPQAQTPVPVRPEPAHVPPEKGNGLDTMAVEDDSPAAAAESGQARNAPLETYRDAYFHAVMAGDEERTVMLVNALIAQRVPMETIYTQVFARSINYIGELYRAGKTDEAHEHMASAITERMMSRVAQFHTPVTHLPYRAILGCVTGNWHELGLRMLADGLKMLGWETLFLSANVPTSSFVAMAQTTKPHLVVVSCAMEEQAEATRELLRLLDRLRASQERPLLQLAVGGHYFLEHAGEITQLPIDFSASDMGQFLSIVQARFPAETPT